jgi:hypothetical protein
MVKSAVEDWDTTAANNTDVGGVDIDENCAMAGMNNSQREIMAQIATARANGQLTYKAVVNFSTSDTLVAGHLGDLVRGTATLTLGTTAAATLGAGWWCDVRADGGVVTIDPNGAETVDGAATLAIPDGASVLIACDGTNFFTTGAGFQTQGDVLDDLNTTGANTADSEFLVGTGAGALAWESGATARTSMGVGTGDSPQFTSIELGHATDTTLTRVSAGVAAVEGKTIYVAGKETAAIDATGWKPEDGAAGPTLATVAGTNHDYGELLFDGASTETAFWKFRAPKGSDESGTLDFTVSYAPKGTSSGNVRFQFSALACGDGDTIDASFGTAVADDSAAGATANVLQRSGAMSVTPGGTWAEGDTIYVKMERLGGHANDTNTDDCGVQEVAMVYTVTANDD